MYFKKHVRLKFDRILELTLFLSTDIWVLARQPYACVDLGLDWHMVA